MGTLLPFNMAKGTLPIPFLGNCNLLGQPQPMPVVAPPVLKALWPLLPPKVCLPPGNLYHLGMNSLKAQGLDVGSLGLPNGTVIVDPITVYVPESGKNPGSDINIEANWTTLNNTANTVVKEIPGAMSLMSFSRLCLYASVSISKVC
jgi:hypothetical protein